MLDECCVCLGVGTKPNWVADRHVTYENGRNSCQLVRVIRMPKPATSATQLFAYQWGNQMPTLFQSFFSHFSLVIAHTQEDPRDDPKARWN